VKEKRSGQSLFIVTSTSSTTVARTVVIVVIDFNGGEVLASETCALNSINLVLALAVFT
jgi:hypothetical protein